MIVLKFLIFSLGCFVINSLNVKHQVISWKQVTNEEYLTFSHDNGTQIFKLYKKVSDSGFVSCLIYRFKSKIYFN